MRTFTYSSLRDLFEQHPEMYQWLRKSTLSSVHNGCKALVEDLGNQCVNVTLTRPNDSLSGPVSKLFEGESSFEQAHAWLLDAFSRTGIGAP